VPFYEYRCDTCEAHFELRRPAGESEAPATCPDGHVGARRLLSVFATAGRASNSAGAPSAGGCCGGSCGCGH
jgi:putative FmdB family regulatory protein